jgi:hypothetical protein
LLLPLGLPPAGINNVLLKAAGLTIELDGASWPLR